MLNSFVVSGSPRRILDKEMVGSTVTVGTGVSVATGVIVGVNTRVGVAVGNDFSVGVGVGMLPAGAAQEHNRAKNKTSTTKRDKLGMVSSCGNYNWVRERP